MQIGYICISICTCQLHMVSPICTYITITVPNHDDEKMS